MSRANMIFLTPVKSFVYKRTFAKRWHKGREYYGGKHIKKVE